LIVPRKTKYNKRARDSSPQKEPHPPGDSEHL
jgi:hypothetical protein